jgi:hypothetical protein
MRNFECTKIFCPILALQDVDLFRSILYLSSYALMVNGTDELNGILIEREKKGYGTILENGTKVQLPLQ